MSNTACQCDRNTRTLASIPCFEEAYVKLRLGKVLIATSLLCGSLIYAQVGTDVEKGAKDTGKATETAAKDTGKAAGTAAKDTGKAADKTGKATDNAAKKTGHGIKTGVKDVGKGVKKGTDKTVDAVK